MKKYIKFIVIGAIVLVVVVVGLFAGKKLLNNESKGERFDIQIQNYNTLYVCFDQNNCPFDYKNDYKELVATNVPKVVSKFINKINSDTIERYNKSKNSELEKSNKCGSFYDVFSHRYGNDMELYKYEDDNYLIVSVKRNEVDYCNGTRNDYQFESYYYDKANDKLVNEEEIINYFDLDMQGLSNIINSYCEKNDVKYISFLDDYSLFINDADDMYISVFNKFSNNYVSIFIKNVKDEK